VAKADVVQEAVEMGLGTAEDLGALTVKVIREKMAESMLDLDGATITVVDADSGAAITTDTITETDEDIQLRCNHDFKTVRVVAHPDNYVADRCYKCGAER